MAVVVCQRWTLDGVESGFSLHRDAETADLFCASPVGTPEGAVPSHRSSVEVELHVYSPLKEETGVWYPGVERLLI